VRGKPHGYDLQFESERAFEKKEKDSTKEFGENSAKSIVETILRKEAARNLAKKNVFFKFFEIVKLQQGLKFPHKIHFSSG
jgi:hypothetical protein